MKVLLVASFAAVSNRVKEGVLRVHPDAEISEFRTIKDFRESDAFQTPHDFDLTFMSCFSEFDSGSVSRSPGVDLAREWLLKTPNTKFMGLSDTMQGCHFNKLNFDKSLQSHSTRRFGIGSIFYPYISESAATKWYNKEHGYDFSAWVQAVLPAKQPA